MEFPPRKKRLNHEEHNQYKPYGDKIYKKMYNASITGRLSDLNQILQNMENQMSTDDLEEKVLKMYTELQLNNIWLDEDVEFILHEFLFKRFFFSRISTSPKEKSIVNSIKLLTELVDFVKFFSDEEEVLIFSLKCIVKEIYQLKRWLRSTYDELPWEEMEFYLICFIISSTEQHDLNVVYKKILNTSDLMKYLSVFASVLEKVKIEKVQELSKLPDCGREEVIQKIIGKYSDFKTLYIDFERIRDIHSLYKISKYAEFARFIQPQEIRGNEFLIRILMVISKHLKYTLASPKLTQITVDFLVLTMTEKSRKIILDVSNADSYEDALKYKAELIQNTGEEFWQTIRDDMEHIGQTAEELLFQHFIQLSRQTWSALEYHTEAIEIIETMFPTLHYIDKKQQQFTKLKRPERNITDQTMKIIQKISSILSCDDPRCVRLNKLAATEFTSNNKGPKSDEVLGYILKPEVVGAISSVHPLTSDAVSELLEILLSIQKDSATNKYEIAKLNAEMINLLMFRTDAENYNEKFKEATKLNQELFSDQKINQARFQGIRSSYADLKNKAVKELKTILDKTKTRKLSSAYKKLKNDKKSFEIMKSLVLDFISIWNIEHNEKADNFPTLHWMLKEYLEYDYELSDLIINSNMATILFAKHLMNPTDRNKVSKVKTSLCDQFSIILKKQKVFSKLSEGDFATFKAFLEEGAEIRAKNAGKSTYLHLAVEKADRSQVEYLSNKGLGVSCQNLKLQTPLHLAASKGNTEVVSFFLEQTYETKQCVDDFGRTALHLAVLGGHCQIIKSLVTVGFDPFFKDHLDLTPLLYAVLNRNKEILCILLLQNKILGQKKQHKKELQKLFQTAVRNNSVEIVEFLLSENYVTLDADNGKDAMHSAVLNGQLEVLDTLLRHGGDPTNFILIAVQKNFDLIVEKIVTSKPDEVNARNPTDFMTALHYAAKNGNDYIIDALLRENADVNAKNVENNTPLHIAVENRHLKAVRSLLRRTDINVNALNSKRFTPLHIAAGIGEYDIAKQLILDKWASIDSQEYSVSPLQLARRNGHNNIAELLVNNGASSKPSNPTRNYAKETQPRPSHKYIALTKNVLDNPSVIIRGADPDCSKSSNDDIINQIIKQNNFKKNIKSKLEILDKYPKEDQCNIIMVVHQSIYEEMMAKKNLNIGWETCSVSDYFHLFRCYKCTGFGHIHTDCENEEICDNCSEKHKTAECESEHFKCVHCINKNKSLGLTLDVNHRPLDQCCNWYKKLLKEKYRKQLKEK